MTRKEKCEYAKSKGFYYNPVNGLIYNKNGLEYKNKHNRGYIYISLYKEQKEYKLLGHHFAWYWVYNEIVDCLDHINGITNDNRIENLRSVTQKENNLNKINVKGYTFDKRSKRYIAQIAINKRNIYLGSFLNEDDARKCYLKGKEKYHKINK